MLLLARWRESLTLIFIALLPMHAVAVTVFTDMLRGAGTAPLVGLALWKEALLAGILFLAVSEIIRVRDTRVWSLDALDWCILLSIALGVYVSFGAESSFTSLSEENRRFLLGFKYDFLPLSAFFLLRRVSWSSSFRQSSAWILVAAGAIFSLVGLVALHLPMSFFMALGYSDLHSLYLPHAPLAAFQMVEGTDLRRLQSVMSGPNQFGLWLLLPIAAALHIFVEAFLQKRKVRSLGAFLSLCLCLVALYYTYSRAAWIGASCIGAVLFLRFLHLRVKSVVGRSIVITSVGVVACTVVFVGFLVAPDIFLRPQSMLGHVQKPLEAITLMREHPFGIGLGTAGPASNHFSSTCVFFDLGADISWAAERTDICVFVGGVQRIPVGKACDCPLLTENWYLQWGVEMGWLGLVLSVLLAFFVLRKLPFNHYPLLTFLGISLAALFLHAWEDAAVAYTVWVLMSAAVSVNGDLLDVGREDLSTLG
jgi:hypothetical protein